MTWEIQVLALNRHKNMVGLNLFMGLISDKKKSTLLAEVEAITY